MAPTTFLRVYHIVFTLYPSSSVNGLNIPSHLGVHQWAEWHSMLLNLRSAGRKSRSGLSLFFVTPHFRPCIARCCAHDSIPLFAHCQWLPLAYFLLGPETPYDIVSYLTTVLACPHLPTFPDREISATVRHLTENIAMDGRHFVRHLI